MLFIRCKYDQRFFLLASLLDRGSVIKVSKPSELPQPCLLTEIDIFPVSIILVMQCKFCFLWKTVTFTKVYYTQ